MQSEKLAGLGQMVAGVAHEINNPLSFVSNNVAVLHRDVAAVAKLLLLYERQKPPMPSSDAASLKKSDRLPNGLILATPFPILPI